MKNKVLQVCSGILLCAAFAPLSIQAQDSFVNGEIARDIDGEYRIFWMQEDASCPGGEFAPPCRLRRKFPDGYSTSTVYQSTVQANSIYSLNIAARDNRIYFLGQSSVLRRDPGASSLSSVTALATKASTSFGEIATSPTHVYWSENNILYRAPIGGGARQFLYTSPFGPIIDLRVDANGVAWFIANAFLAPLTMTRIATNGTATYGPAFTNSFTLDDFHVYMVVGDGTAERRLRRATLGNLPAHLTGIQLHPAGDVTAANFTTIANDDTYLYYFKDVLTASQEVIWRLAKSSWSSGSPSAITGQRVAVDDLLVTPRYLFWRQGISNIYRLDLAAATAIEADARINSIEVVQSVQLLDNSIPLSDKKPTTARVYAELASVTGLSSVNVTVTLVGARDGFPLAFPPPAQTRVLSLGAPDRKDPADSFNFLLPYAWREGTIELRATVTISGIADTSTPNNTFDATGLVFRPKAPVCIKYLPILNTAGINYRVRNLSTGEFNPAWLDIYRRFVNLWPSPEVLFYTQTVSLRKPQFLGTPRPFNMEDGADKDHLMAALWEHNVWDGAPSWCERDNARTHYFAMVPPEISGGPSGYARLGEPLFYVKMFADGNVSFDRPRSGSIVMQEIVHTYNNIFGTDEAYQHVNCGLPAGGDFNAFYPWDPNSIGLTGGSINPAAGWGYDHITGRVIPPDPINDDGTLVQAADYMSYCGPRWGSDYSWLRMINKIPDRPAVRDAGPQRGTPLVTDVLMVSGLITRDETSGEIFTAFHVPPGLEVESSATAGTGEFGASGTYVLELLNGGGGLLASYPVVPTHTEDHTDDVEAYYFHATVPYSAGLASFRVRRTDVVIEIATAAVSPNAPTVSIGAPSAGATLNAPLTIDWTASDLDGGTLSYIVQYSADGGTTWSAISAQQDTSTLVLTDTSNLAASSEAYLRVIARDGINMGFDTVGPMTMPNHPPAPFIMMPVEGTLFEVNEAATVEGSAIDFDEGLLDGSNLNWSITGPTTVSGSGPNLIFRGLPPGTYNAALTSVDSFGLSGTDNVSFTVETKRIADGAAPAVDGFCEDAGYLSDPNPLMLEYGFGAPAVARFVHAGSATYICVSGLLLIASPSNEHINLYFDINNSDESSPQSGDLHVRLRRNGSLLTETGSGGSFNTDSSPFNVDGIISGSGTSTWSAEIRIDDSRLGGWNHLAGVSVGHEFGGSTFAWPFDSLPFNPSTWGTVALGLQSQVITFNQPLSMVVGDPVMLLNATASSGLPVTFTSQTTAVCEIVGGNQVIALSGGTCTIEASQPGNASYSAATPVLRSFGIDSGEIDAGEPNDSFAAAAPIAGACPQLTLSRRLAPAGDVDFYSFTAPPDLPVAVDIDANEGGGSTLNSVAGVFDSGGSLVAVSDNDPAPGEMQSLDSYLQFNMPASGSVVIAVAGFDDLDFNGTGTQGSPSSGNYDLDIRCSPEPGQLLATTGSASNLLLDLDPKTGEGVTRAELGRYGPLTDIEFCNGVLFGSVGGGTSRLITIDRLTGHEELVCDLPADAVAALACIDGDLHGSWSTTVPPSSADLVKIENPTTTVRGSFNTGPVDIESTAPSSFDFTAATGEVSQVTMQLNYVALGAAWGSDLYIELTHLPTGIKLRYGTATPGASCDVYGGCDVDLGWANSTGGFSANIVTPLILFNGGGDWDITIQTFFDNPDSPEGSLLSGSWSVESAECSLSTVGNMGQAVPGMAWWEDNQELLGCNAAGNMLLIDHLTGTTNELTTGTVGNCRAATIGTGSSPTFYGGTGSGGQTQTPGLLFTYDLATGETTPIGQNFAGAISGLVIVPADTDRDGILDVADNCLAAANPDQRDTDNDGLGNLCDADIAPVVNDCFVNFPDLNAMADAFFSNPQSPNWNPDADLNGDNFVNFVDLSLMSDSFFTPPGPSGIPNICQP